jgi:type VI secretion system Hcp family effector
MQKTFTTCVLAVAFSVIVVGAASAQVQTFMLVPGIPGGSVDDQHKNWIDVIAVTQTLDSNGRRRSSCEIQVVKGLDIAGPPLWAAAVTGQAFPEIRVDVFRPGGDSPSRLYEIKLGNAHVSTIATNVGYNIAETLTLVAETATLTVFPQKPDGTVGTPVTATVSCR